MGRLNSSENNKAFRIVPTKSLTARSIATNPKAAPADMVNGNAIKRLGRPV